MSLIRTALPFAVFVVCQMFQSRCVASTTEQAISATVSGVAQVHVPAAKRKRSRWLLDQPALPFAVAFRRVTANFEQRSTQAQAPDAGQTLLDASAIPTARTRWMSEQALGRRWVVLLLAPRIQQTARGGRYGQQSVPQPQVLLTLAQMAKQLTNRGAETFLILPDSKAEEKTYNLLQQSQQTTGDSGIDALRLCGDEATWRLLGRGFKSTRPAIVVLDRAGFVRRAQTVNSWNDVNDLLSGLNDPTPIVEVGRLAPSFAVRDMNGTLRRLEDYRGRNLLLTFFPKCFTGHCTNHLTSIQAVWSDLAKSNTQVLAVSVDEAEGIRGQQAFARSMGLSFPLVPDVGRNLSILFGAATYPQELASRMSVLIDSNGSVRWISKDIVMNQHGLDVLTKVKELDLTTPLPTPKPQ